MLNFGKTCSAIIIKGVNDWALIWWLLKKVDVAWKLLSVFYDVKQWFLERIQYVVDVCLENIIKSLSILGKV